MILGVVRVACIVCPMRQQDLRHMSCSFCMIVRSQQQLVIIIHGMTGKAFAACLAKPAVCVDKQT